MSALCWVIPFLLAQTEPVPREGVKPFAPGIRIDWSNLTVELESEVALREGPLELFACSPRTKEHESVLVIFARPTQIYQALGLVGFTPGSPTRYVEKEDRWEPARGDALDLRVRWLDGDTARFARPEEWILQSDRDKTSTPPALAWVFAGSLTSKEGRFAADMEGTVASVVDFESSLIALSTRHSADNEQLWLVANKDAIPPRGTRCQLLIRAAARPPIRATLRSDGSLSRAEQSIPLAELAAMLRPTDADPRPTSLELCQESTDATKDAFLAKLGDAGYSGPIQVEKPPCRPPTGTMPSGSPHN